MDIDYSGILNTITENGRVLTHDDGSFVTESLRVETEFEAHERGLTFHEVAEAIAFAMDHATHHD